MVNMKGLCVCVYVRESGGGGLVIVFAAPQKQKSVETGMVVKI